ncbi:Asp-tRNA(Asn)/Glu-tRNA(Gln) amidotransferase subunit GatC [Patescibacteria group bacterium]|nr:Asp-tRNA(Asn)/Glu-tRNA(Gln) amidotransferase subunit GatC [Patescibacteria group bacterium]
MKIDILKVAKLANLELKDDEKNELEKQLSTILEYIDKLKELNTENVEETSQVTNLENVEREDSVLPSLTQEQALSNAAKKHEGFFEVEAIFE